MYIGAERLPGGLRPTVVHLDASPLLPEGFNLTSLALNIYYLHHSPSPSLHGIIVGRCR